MKVLLWAPYGAGEHYWGPGMSAYNLYRKYQGNDLEITLVHGFKKQKKYPLFHEQIFLKELNGNKISLLRYLANSKSWIINNAHNYDVAHILGDRVVSFLPAIWLEKNQIPTAIKIKSANFSLVKSSFMAKLIGWHSYILSHKNHITRYISISKKITDQLLKVGVAKEKVAYIPNGVDMGRFSKANIDERNSLREKLGFESKFTVLFTGGLSSRKRPSLIVETFVKFKNRDDIQLLIVGPDRDNGSERLKIERIIESEKLKNVYLIPFSNEIEKYYKISDIFVLLSKNEGLSNSLLEAQSCGVPAIVTEISGSEDIIRDNYNGFLIRPDSNSLEDKINFYWSNKAKLNQHSIHSIERITRKFDSNKILAKHIDLFKSIA